jgi:hypothetical protein
VIHYLISFLKCLEEVIPPPLGTHHALTIARYDTEDGRIDRLALRIVLDAGPEIPIPHSDAVVIAPKFLTLHVEAGDFNKPVTVLAAECAVLAERARLKDLTTA